MTQIAFEDLIPGATRRLGDIRVEEEAILAFAREYDNQPMHTDPQAAKATMARGLIASGWHTCSLLMRAIADDWLLDSTSRGSPGIDEVKWLQPVRPGDTLSVEQTIRDRRVSAKRPDLGIVQFGFVIRNQAGEIVLEQANPIMFGLRHPGVAPHEPAAASTAAPPRIVRDNPDTVQVEAEAELGDYLFTAEGIKAFARQFDPQPFHLDEEAAKSSLFGGLCASGWQTAAAWMKMMIAYRAEEKRVAEASGSRQPAFGPSPGFRNLQWLRPVFAGETISYRSALFGARPLASRPGWEIVSHRNIGMTAEGTPVFRFEGKVFRQSTVA